jgi:threonine/homoserine/homoserine lactone efflux protein
MDPLLAAYLSFTFLIVATPGATTAVVIRNTLDGGRRAGFGAALGAAAGNCMQALLAGVGVALLVRRSPVVLEALRLGGGGYLLWLGLRGLWRAVARPLSQSGDLEPLAARHALHLSVREGFAVNMLNPAIVSFYVAVVPSFLPATRPPSWFALLAACHVAIAFLCHSAWVVGLDALRGFFRRPRARLALEIATGLALVALAARVLTG